MQSIFGLSFLLPALVASSAVKLITFDGDATTTHEFKELNDPVMGGKSSGTWTVDASGFGVFDGEVVDVPSLSAPGFIKAAADGTYPDASAEINGDVVLTVRSSTPDYAGFRMTFVSGTASPSYSCSGGGSLPFSRGCFKAKFSVPAGDDFKEVRIPLASFSDKWSPATGEQTTTCADDSDVCPSASKLSKIERVEIWAEGALGKVHLEIKEIAFSTGSQSEVLSLRGSSAVASDICNLYGIDGDACQQSSVDCKYAKYAKAFEKSLKDGTCLDQGYTVQGSCQTKSFPVVGDIIICKYTKATQVLSLEAKSSGTCPGSPAFVHASAEISLDFSNACNEVSAVILDRLNRQQTGAWIDPHNGGNYTFLKATSANGLLFSRAAGSQAKTPKGPDYDDQLMFTFDPTSEGGCKVSACSESHVTSVIDYGTNYCNMHDLICNNVAYCGDSKLNYTEMVISCGTLGVNCKTSVEATCFQLKQPTQMS